MKIRERDVPFFHFLGMGFCRRQFVVQRTNVGIYTAHVDEPPVAPPRSLSTHPLQCMTALYRIRLAINSTFTWLEPWQHLQQAGVVLHPGCSQPQ